MEGEPRPRRRERDGRSDDERIDEASAESFPASDPPAYRDMQIGGPRRDAHLRRRREDRRHRP